MRNLSGGIWTDMSDNHEARLENLRALIADAECDLEETNEGGVLEDRLDAVQRLGTLRTAYARLRAGLSVSQGQGRADS
jgi:hypothetical protein